MTIKDQWEQLQPELAKLEENEQNALLRDDYYQLITTYKQMIRLLQTIPFNRRGEHREEDQGVVDEVSRTKNYCSRKLIESYVKYGAFLKMNTAGHDGEARHSLQRALHMEPCLPIAYYRLGHLAYRSNDYEESLGYFHQALVYQTKVDRLNGKYKLNDAQSRNAHLFIALNSLKLFAKHKKLLNNDPTGYHDMDEYIRHTILADEAAYRKREFYKVNQTGAFPLSMDERDILLEEPDCLLLDFTGRDTSIIYNRPNGRETQVTLAPEKMNLLVELLKASEQEPLSAASINQMYLNTFDIREVSQENFRQSIHRIRTKLGRIGLGEIILHKRPGPHSRNSGYYMEPIPYWIIKREEDMA